MEQIELYYTKNLKYLKLGDYVRYFYQESIDEMLACIKNQETPVKIFANSDDVKRHKFSDNGKILYSYAVLPEKPIFGKSPLEDILQNFIDSHKDFLDYPVVGMWQDVLGQDIFICNSRERQLKIVAEDKYLAFTPPDLAELQKSMTRDKKVPYDVCVRCFFTDKEIEENDNTDTDI